jgi:hypothetical protein
MLADKTGTHSVIEQLPYYRVQDMDDRGMGGVRILTVDQRTRKFGRALAEAEYADEDEVVVSITVNVDNRGELYELDFWKVDFSPLKRYPQPQQLRVKTR